MPNSDLQLYSKSDLENARTKGQVVGWVQGAGALVLLGIVFQFIGLIPLIVVGAIVVFVIAKAFSK